MSNLIVNGQVVLTLFLTDGSKDMMKLTGVSYVVF
jgi:hypothetical protein